MLEKSTGVVFWFVVGLIATGAVIAICWIVFNGYLPKVSDSAPSIPTTLPASHATVSIDDVPRDRLHISL